MINTVGNRKYQTFAFDNITDKDAISNYWLNPENSSVSQNPASYNSSQTILNDIKIITPDEARKTKNTKLIGLSVAGATVMTGIGVFTLMRGGGNRKFMQGLQFLKGYLENKIERIKINDKHVEKIDKTYMLALEIIDNLMKKSEAINNFTTFKDLLFKKLMHTNDLTGKLHDSITSKFEKIGRHAVLNAYSESENKIIEAQFASRKILSRIKYEEPEKVIEIGKEKYTKKQLLEMIKSLDEALQKSYEENFDIGAVKKRYYTIKQIAELLEAGLTKLKSFFSKNVYHSFMADLKIAKQKGAVINEVKNKRRIISYTEAEMIKRCDERLSRVAECISFRDKEGRELLYQIKHSLKVYAKNPSSQSDTGKLLLSYIDTLASNIKEGKISRNSKNYDKNEKVKELLEIKEFITTYKPGIVENILDIYKKILQPQDYKNIERVYKKGIQSLDKAVRVETEDFTNKLRDLTMGSAPTDLLTMIGSLGVLGYQLGKSDDNDQRTSIALKYGFPAIAGIAVTLYCNAKLFAGSKALIIGSVSSWLINRIGSMSDDYIKQHKSKVTKP